MTDALGDRERIQQALRRLVTQAGTDKRDAAERAERFLLFKLWAANHAREEILRILQEGDPHVEPHCSSRFCLLASAATAYAQSAWVVSENALYYTLSTIAQTLAAAFGILTAIVVVRLPAIENAVENAKGIILTHHGDANYERAWLALRQHGFSGYRAAGFHIEGHLVNMQLAGGHRAWVSWGKVISSVRLALIPTGVDIGACFLALPVVPWLAPNPAMAWTVVVLTVAAAVLCLVSYGWLVTRLVGQRVP